jgi:hypothetical protein
VEGNPLHEIRAGGHAGKPLRAKPHLVAAFDPGYGIQKPGVVDAAVGERSLRIAGPRQASRADPRQFLEHHPLDHLAGMGPGPRAIIQDGSGRR